MTPIEPPPEGEPELFLLIPKILGSLPLTR
jgi:hypothetical protein